MTDAFVTVYVCRHDGIQVGESRAGRLVHLDELPKDLAEHDIDLVEADEYLGRQDYAQDLRAAAQDMLVHHASLHPHSGCSWAERLEAATRTR